VLEDGSEVILNSKSSVSYNAKDWENERELTLKGEGYFKVAKGETFTVITPNGSVQVLGTQFVVNSTRDFFDVTCFEGKVRVITNDNISHILLPGENIRKINGFETQNLDSEDDAPSWISGESTFKSVPLKYVIKALENEYNISIDASQVDTSILFSGAFPHNDTKVALQTVFGSLDIKYENISKGNLKLSNSK
jgi:ferric-dicitrate binding protein FerR (iron transport regulator)